MKRVILIASLIVLASCKKEKISETSNGLDCKCGIVTNVEFVSGPGYAYFQKTARNQCSNNNKIITIVWAQTVGADNVKVGDYVCTAETW